VADVFPGVAVFAVVLADGPHGRSLRYGPHFCHWTCASRASFRCFCSVTSTIAGFMSTLLDR
jgi:hypothetical protein